MYGKLFTSMWRGSLYGHWKAMVTFQQMIMMADKHGEVDATPEAISAITSIPLDIIREGIAELEAPDPTSRTPDEEGRRIIRVSDERPWGWRITNYTTYRNMRSAEERRDYFKQYKREVRAKARNAETSPDSTGCPQVSTDSTKAVGSKQNAKAGKAVPAGFIKNPNGNGLIPDPLATDTPHP